MSHLRLLAVPFGLLLLALPALAEDKDGFVPMFDGKTLNGWVNVNCHPSTFYVKDGEIITTGRPTGYLRTAKQYENFIAEFDWMHVNKDKVGNSGFFVWCDPLPAVGTGYSRGIEVQVLVNLEYKNKKGEITATSHGDLFSIWGAHCKPDRPHPDGWERCLPSENRAKGGGEWNHYKVTANDGVIKLEVNGKEVSGISQCTPRKGYLALESEGAECHFRNLMIKELPSTHPKPSEVADVDRGLKSMFNGLDLSGWKADQGGWKPADGVLRSAGQSPIQSEKKYDRFELQFDWRLTGKSPPTFSFTTNDNVQVSFDLKSPKFLVTAAPHWTIGAEEMKFPKPGEWSRVAIKFDGETYTMRCNGKPVAKLTTSKEGVAAPIQFNPATGLELRSIYIRDLK